MMKRVALFAACAAAAGCSDPVPTAARPSSPAVIEPSGNVVGEVAYGSIAWTDNGGVGPGELGGWSVAPPASGQASDSADPNLPTFAVRSLTCDGCNITWDPPGTQGDEIVPFNYIPTTDGAITLTALLAWDSDGSETTATTTFCGDREASVTAGCYVMPASELDSYSLADAVPCGETRTSDQTVLIAPVVQTERGAVLEPNFGSGLSLPSTAFTFSAGTPFWFFDYAQMADLGDATSVEVSAQLATGETVSTTVAIPPLVAGGPPSNAIVLPALPIRIARTPRRRTLATASAGNCTP